MKLRDIYQKDIFRSIEGVIKADDESHIQQEVDEYVITREILQKMDDFFKVYASSIGSSKVTSDIGVWISGFFGSGKSHLLKMLSYILEDRKINGKSVAEIFLNKIDESDFELRANLEKSAKIPAKSILFNIDQKADITSKTQADAILSVFMKVFNEMQGYYPKYGFLADFERDLDKQGLYQKFKEKYRENSGESWEKGREAIFLEIENFAKTLSQVKGISEEDASKVIDQYESKYKLSIEDFVKKVKDYIDKQPDNFRLIFCVDEMGQYISDNTKLMLNLETIAESLSTICKGQAWIVVTSQEDMETIVGDMSSKQAYDYSRIQDRFATRLNLSSANVDEVIHKRILAKKDQCKPQLENLYQKERNNFKTIFYFSEGSRQYQTYKDITHFNFTYPFVPYQFDLFQSCMRGLSRNNAFQGRHQSVGERSMLGVFQLVAQYNADKEIGKLVTFDQLFDGIRATLRGEIQSAVIHAEKNLDNPFDVKVLKALFLVKYVKEFKSTARNIVTFLVDHFEENLSELEKKVQESLNRLEDQTYVQQVTGVYEFLTDDEKDVENEIKATEVDPGSLKKFLGEIIFLDIIKDTKIRYEDNKQDYSFARKLDHQYHSKEDVLAVHFISPLCDETVNESILKAESMGRRELIIQLAEDTKLHHELGLYKKTEKYIQQTVSSALSDSIKGILRSKGEQNTQRRRDLISRVEQLITNGIFYLNGNILELNGTQAKFKIEKAFQELIKVSYPNLRMLKKTFKEEDLKSILFEPTDDLFRGDDETMSEAELELLNFIERRNAAHERVTTKNLLEHFSANTYGWYQSAILGILAMLYRRDKVEITHSGNELDKMDMLKILNNNREFPNTIIEPVKDIDKHKIQRFKDFYLAFFDEAVSEMEVKPIAARFKSRLDKEITALETWYTRQSQYPFLSVFEPILKELRHLKDKDTYWYFNNLEDFKDKLLESKNTVLDPIKQFLNSDQRKIYDEIIDFLGMQEANLGYISDQGVNILNSLRESKHPYQGNQIKEGKASLEKIKSLIHEKIEEEKQQTFSVLDEYLEKIKNNQDFSKLKPEEQNIINGLFESLKEKLPHQKYISVIRDQRQNISDSLYPSALKKIEQFNRAGKPEDERDPKKEIISLSSIKTGYYKPTIDDENDVERFIEVLKKQLIAEIKKNKKISV